MTRTKIGENELFEFFIDDWCSLYQMNINDYDRKGVTLPDKMRVVLCRNKEDGHESYLAIDTKNRPYMEWDDGMEFEFKLMAVRLKIAEEYDIRNMAKKVKK